jgi:hypothetical protein
LTDDASADLQPILPDEYKHLSIDQKNPRYAEAHAAAKDAGLTQAQFTKLLGYEACAVLARQAAAAPAPAAAAPPPAPAKPEPIPGYASMSFAEKFMIGERRKQEGK